MNGNVAPYHNLETMWEAAVEHTLRGSRMGSRDGKCSEVIGWASTLTDPRRCLVHNEVRALSPAYGYAELLWYLSRKRDASMLLDYAPQYERFTEDGTTAWGAYGYRVANNAAPDQFSTVASILAKDPDSRQAVVTLWRADDLTHAMLKGKRDLPCTILWQFLVRDGALHMIAYMRSNDVWMGMPYDVFCNCHILGHLATQLGLDVGTYTHHVGSLHLYDRNRERAELALASRPEDLGSREALKIDESGFRAVKHALRWEREIVKARKERRNDVDVKFGDLGECFSDAIACIASHWKVHVSRRQHPLVERMNETYADHRGKRLRR